MIRVVDLRAENFEASAAEFLPASFTVSLKRPLFIPIWDFGLLMLVSLANVEKSTVAIIIVPVAIFVALELIKSKNEIKEENR